MIATRSGKTRPNSGWVAERFKAPVLKFGLGRLAPCRSVPPGRCLSVISPVPKRSPSWSVLSRATEFGSNVRIRYRPHYRGACESSGEDRFMRASALARRSASTTYLRWRVDHFEKHATPQPQTQTATLLDLYAALEPACLRMYGAGDHRSKSSRRSMASRSTRCLRTCHITLTSPIVSPAHVSCSSQYDDDLREIHD
jgi:hypothetical protein